VAAGGIFDGRGLAAALMLGAVGVNLGTRFLASKESPIEDGYQQAVLNARSEDTVKADALNAINPKPGTIGYGTVLRAIRTPFLEEWNAKLDEAVKQRERLQGELRTATQTRTRYEYIIGAGQSAGGIDEVLPAAEIISRVVAEAEAALRAASVVVA